MQMDQFVGFQLWKRLVEIGQDTIEVMADLVHPDHF